MTNSRRTSRGPVYLMSEPDGWETLGHLAAKGLSSSGSFCTTGCLYLTAHAAGIVSPSVRFSDTVHPDFFRVPPMQRIPQIKHDNDASLFSEFSVVVFLIRQTCQELRQQVFCQFGGCAFGQWLEISMTNVFQNFNYTKHASACRIQLAAFASSWSVY